jgi:hypothetical protein
VVLAVAVVVPVVVVLGSLLAIGIFHAVEGRPVPSFPSLAADPDPSLHGTVAYYDQATRCVRIVAAAGSPSKDVLCLPPWTPDPERLKTEGKEIGPQLAWRTDGRLEVTMMFMPVTEEKRGAPPVPGWQKLVDVATGAVEDVPAADVPSSASAVGGPVVNGDGERLAWTSNEQTGRVKVTVTGADGTRTLLSAHGPGEYGYRLSTVAWAPDGRWIVADDGRILVITPTDPPRTRVLVDGGGGSTEYPTFAVTATDLLATPHA